MSTQEKSSGLLEGRVAVITGAVGALGRGIATRFAEHGAAVVIADLNDAACVEVAEQIAASTGARTLGLAMDVTSRENVEAAAHVIEERFGICDVVAANAGLLLAKPALEISAAEWERTLRVNLTGAFTTATVFAGRMVAADRAGSIMFTSSLFGTRGGVGNSAYSASKFGVIGLAQSMAAELAPRGIRVNSVCPGQISSAMLDELFERRAEQSGRTAREEQSEFEQRIPLGRLGTADDVADTFLYLASGLSSYVTGQALVVDGGWNVG